VKRIHFVGIGGSGMSGIAEVFSNLGYTVTGSDLSENPAVRRLRQLGVKIVIGHAAANVANADAVVVSSAVKEDNPEVQRAREAHVPVMLLYFHYPEKTIGVGPLLEMTPDLEADMRRIREFYLPWQGKNRGSV
jgi:UDP-N-acetylmuramoylalanine-D-glutamate ligase